MSPAEVIQDLDKFPCQGCEKPMVWGHFWNEDRKPVAGITRVPLDPSAPCYKIIGRDAQGQVKVERARDTMVSHFKTCSKACQFSGGVKPGEPEEKVPILGDYVEVVNGPFIGLHGVLSREGKVGPGVHPQHRPFLDWWLTVRDGDGADVGLCMVGKNQIRFIA